METTLYKVVWVKDNKYTSICTSHKYVLTYTFGEKTFPLIGKIFGFLDIDYLKLYLHRIFLNSNEVVVFECRGELSGEMENMLDVYASRNLNRDIPRFWSDGKEVPIDVPYEGTCLFNWVVPLRQVPFNTLNLEQK